MEHTLPMIEIQQAANWSKYFNFVATVIWELSKLLTWHFKKKFNILKNDTTPYTFYDTINFKRNETVNKIIFVFLSKFDNIYYLLTFCFILEWNGWKMWKYEKELTADY